MSKKKKISHTWYYEEASDIYDLEDVEELLYDDEISAEEEAFMIGYNQY